MDNNLNMGTDLNMGTGLYTGTDLSGVTPWSEQWNNRG